jgi:hypothetical protein
MPERYLVGHAKGVEAEVPVGAAHDLLVKRRELPEVKRIVHRIDLLEEVQQWVVEDFLHLQGLGNAGRQARQMAQPLLGLAVEAFGQALGRALPRVGDHIEAGVVTGADRGINADAREGCIFQLGEQLVRRRVAVAFVGVHEAGAGPLAAGQSSWVSLGSN